MAELEALVGRTATIGELRGLVTKTRPAKRRADAADLSDEWWRRAKGLGLAPRDLARCTRAVVTASPPPDSQDVFRRLGAPDGLCSARSVLTRGDVLTGLVDLAVPDASGTEQPLVLPADAIDRLADEFLASDYVVELLPSETRSIATLGDQPLFTTAEMLSVQARVLDRFRTGQSARAAVVPAEVLGEALDLHDHLTAEQRDLVASFCTSGHRAQCGIGRAGAGKTTAMRAAVAAWTAAGYRVLGTAVKGEAARHLGNEAGIQTETLAWHLAHTDPRTSALDGRTVLIVDEASTISDRDLYQLLWLCDATGAAVRLIGDPSQHGAVGAGGMFRVLCLDDGAQTPELRTSHRVLDPHDRAAADALREGRIGDALAALEAAGHLHVVSNEVDLHLDLLDRWWKARLGGSEHPMVDRRNHTRRQLNRLAHRLLQVTGEVGSDEIIAAHDRRFSVGDRVVARNGDRTLHPAGRPGDYVRNGANGVVVAVGKHRKAERETIRVTFADLGEVDLPRAFFDEHSRRGGRTDVGLDHAYAVTSYAVQGATFAESTSRIDENASRSETYVDITRGRSANHLYLTRSVDPLDGERLPKAPAPPIAAAVTAQLSSSGPERAAVDVDPGAPAAATARTGRDLAELHASAIAGGDVGSVAAAEELRARQVARLGARSLDPSLLDRLPPRSHLPFLARQWDEAVTDLSVFRARWNASPDGHGRWGWALGPPGSQTGMGQERRRIAARLVDVAVAAAQEAAHGAGYELPHWARAHLGSHAALGTCAHDPDELRTLYKRIDDYRSRAGVKHAEHPKTAEDAIFGEPPEDDVLRMKRRALVDETLPRDTTMTRPAPSRASA